ncbi:ATP-dependent DNA helicase RRM3-like [Apium graveolens]|uniref:ATP-dependent DNA helicase RRM3-like n=1 Tax=Apium graveolens TaxID=4045 RepID=UPI003D7BC4EA
MALQYPLLFPRGEDGFHPKIKFQKTADSSCKPRGFLSLKNYYSYTFQIRESDGKILRTNIKDKKHFGVCIGVMYVIDFKKRGLPHVHMLIWLDADSKKNLKQNVDNFVSAEIPNPLLDPVGYAAVKEFMIHGPCGDKNCTFRANEVLGKVAAREKNKFSKLKAFFYLNSVDVNARKYTYDEIPRFYVWNDGERKWTMRKRGFQIGRLCYVHHSTGEPWFLRLLLMKVRGATSFESLYTVNGVCYSTFRDARKEYGLLDDDKEWHEVLTQASAGGLPPQISNIAEIDELFRSVGKSSKKFDQLPQPPRSYLNNGTNNLIIEETSYDTRKMEYETAKLLQDCTEEQRKIYDAVIQSIDTNVGGIFFVYGVGGCGKTFLWRTLICKLRSQGKIVLPVASSGIAATLMPGGRTAHSRFKIPIVLDECSTCNISHDSDVAQLIKQTQLIIWDEAPMQHMYVFECLDRSLKDIMKAVDLERYAMSFGGITVVLGGDFRQILPVITYGDRADIVAACITRSRLWSICQVFLLTENMRLKQGESDSESEELKKFAKWVLDIGNGQVGPPRVCNFPVTENQILIPSQFCDVQTENTVDNMIRNTYHNFAHKGQSTQYLSERAILTPTIQTVGHLNSLIVDKLPGESVSYFSVDAAEEFGGTDENLNEAFPIEYLNSLNVAGMPPHDLKLKVGAVVMLMRNLNQTLGLCNGTRMIVTKCLRFCVECEVICGTYVGSKHFIPRMELSPSDTKMPFKLVWKQMPLQICYAVTINKSQGQSLKTVGLYLPKSVFSHGQYYVAISRVTSPTSLTIFVDDESGAATNITQNVVYKEVFYGLPEA